VLALGSASQRVASTLGMRLPVYPLKGYSITVDTGDAPGPAPRVNVTDTARKMVFARIGQRLRVAGMAELVGHNTHIPPARIERLRDAANAVFPGCSHVRELNPWTGMRPATPKGVPLVAFIAAHSPTDWCRKRSCSTSSSPGMEVVKDRTAAFLTEYCCQTLSVVCGERPSKTTTIRAPGSKARVCLITPTSESKHVLLSRLRGAVDT
jgi:hypothetical protein